VDVDVASCLRDDAVYGREPEPGALGIARPAGVVRLEDAVELVALDPAPVVGDRDPCVGTGKDFRAALGIDLVEIGVIGGDRQQPARRHRVAGVDRKLDHGLLDLGGVGLHRPKPLAGGDLHLDVLPQGAAQELVEPGDRRI
jgi:hypothetical protein